MSREGKKDDGPKRDPNAWMVTFSDLVTLMITFFVMLLTMSTLDVSKLKEMFQYFPGASTVMEGGSTVQTTQKESMIEMVRITSRAGEENWLDEQDIESFHALKRWLADRLLDDKVKVVRREDRFEIHLDNDLLFDKGSVQLTEQSQAFLAEVAQTMERLKQVRMRIITVAADKREIKGSKTFENLEELATGRAATLVLRFINTYGIDAERLSMMGYDAAMLPKNDKTFSQRVELVFMQRDDVPDADAPQLPRGQ